MNLNIFKNEKRNNSLRSDILNRFIGGIMTDDERAELFGLPEGCRIREGAKIISPEKFKCGKYVWIGENAILDASGGLDVGDHTSIGLSVFVWSHTSWLENFAMENYQGSDLIERKPTKIGSGCFIAGPSVIYAGVTIGDRIIVTPNSVVTRDFTQEYAVLAGNPAKIIKVFSKEFIEKEIKRMRNVQK